MNDTILPPTDWDIVRGQLLRDHRLARSKKGHGIDTDNASKALSALDRLQFGKRRALVKPQSGSKPGIITL